MNVLLLLNIGSQYDRVEYFYYTQCKIRCIICEHFIGFVPNTNIYYVLVLIADEIYEGEFLLFVLKP